MIEFCGEIDGRCKKYRLYVESMVGLVCTLIPALLIAIPDYLFNCYRLGVCAGLHSACVIRCFCGNSAFVEKSTKTYAPALCANLR